MKTCLPIIFLLTLSRILPGQDIAELERRNGFKNIKLAMPVDSISGIHYKKDIKVNDEFDAVVYTVENEDYARIGEVEVKKVEVTAYKGYVYEIAVITAKDTRVVKALESIYGKAEYDQKLETYFWKGNNITLKFRSHSRHQLEMVYHSQLIRKMMKDDKGKKVEAIADDF